MTSMKETKKAGQSSMRWCHITSRTFFFIFCDDKILINPVAFIINWNVVLFLLKLEAVELSAIGYLVWDLEQGELK